MNNRFDSQRTSRASLLGRAGSVALLLILSTLGTVGQTLSPAFVGSYSVRDLGAAGDVPGGYGALLFKAGDSNTLFVAGNSDDPTAKIYQIRVTRDSQNHITGFAATSSRFADAPGIPPQQPLDVEGGIDGGLDYGPGGVLFYTTYYDGSISQIKPGATSPGKQTRMSALGIDGAGGALLFVPAGFSGAGRLKLAGATSFQWFDTAVTADGTGTYNIAAPAKTIEIVNYARGLIYVKAGRPVFAHDSVVITSEGDDRVVTYEVDSNGDPIPATLREVLTGYYRVKGATRDPVTGDFLFANGDFNSPRIVLVGVLGVGQTQVQITAPADGSSYTAPGTFLVNAEATQPGGSIARVDFYLGASLLFSASHPPFGAFADSLPAGSYTLTAVAVDGSGNATTSAPVHVSVVNNGPHVTLVYPTNNTVLAACSSLTMVAQVQPGNAGIVSVEFFEGPTRVSVSHDPYNFEPYRWTAQDLDEGTRVFSVTVTDGNGLMSAAFATNVVVEPLPPNKLVIHHFVPDQLKFCFKGVAGSNYVWETEPHLLPPQWAPLLTNTATAAKLQVTNQFDNRIPSGFYRTRRAP
jgi:hypothetical protein